MPKSRRVPGLVLGGWRGILSHIPQTPMALRRRGREQLAAGNVSKASQLADRLARIDPRREAHLRGEILAYSQPHHDHTDFWATAAARFPSDTDFVRKTIHAALKAGKVEMAEAGLRNLIDSGRTRSHDANFVIGLANVYARQADRPKIRLVVRQYLRSLRRKPDYRIAAVRLSRLIFAHFPGNHSQADDNRGLRTEERFLTMLARSSAPPKPKAILQRVVEMQRSLTSSASMTLFDTDISQAQCRKFIALIHDRLATGNGFSFIRLGDGESSCLPYEPHLSGFAQQDTAERERMWWGAELEAPDRVRFSRQISAAIWNADSVGIPTVARILRDVRLSENDELESGRVGRGLRAVLYAFENIEHLPLRRSVLPLFTSCHLHQDILRWNLYPELFEASREIVLISCHPGLAEIVEQRFGARVAASIIVPPRHASMPLFRGGAETSRFLPETVEDVAEQLGELPRGRLVLVGAGYLGKRLIDLAKARGGVALDLGSMLDHWAGVNTRSYLDLAPN